MFIGVGWGFLLNLVGFPLNLYSAVSCVYPDVSYCILNVFRHKHLSSGIHRNTPGYVGIQSPAGIYNRREMYPLNPLYVFALHVSYQECIQLDIPEYMWDTYRIHVGYNRIQQDTTVLQDTVVESCIQAYSWRAHACP